MEGLKKCAGPIPKKSKTHQFNDSMAQLAENFNDKSASIATVIDSSRSAAIKENGEI